MFTSWQDTVFTIGLVYYVWSTFPVLKMKELPPLQTCIAYGLIPSCYIAPQLSYGNYLAAFITAILCVQWMYISYQKWKQG